MIKSYVVRAPFIVRINERVVHRPGEVIALDAATARLHEHKLVEVAKQAAEDKRKGRKDADGEL